MKSVTVILCTYNRCDRLAKALASAAVQTMPADAAWEVLVVDNNSRDETREVVERFRLQYPGRFRYLFEPTPGKSHALNSGIQQARGDLLAFLDDDAIAAPDWLASLTRSLQLGKANGAGGRILPDRAIDPPPWLSLASPYAKGPLVTFDCGAEPGVLNTSPFGTNMAFTKEMFQIYGGFRTELGAQPGSDNRQRQGRPHAGEDSEFGERLLHAGERLWYEPSAIVYHEVRQDRLRREYFEHWWFDKGRADAYIAGDAGPRTLKICGVPLRLLRRFGMWSLRWWFALDEAQRFENKLATCNLSGQIVERYRQSRQNCAAL